MMCLQLIITLHKLTSAIFLHTNSFSPAASHLSVHPDHLASTGDMKVKLIIYVSHAFSLLVSLDDFVIIHVSAVATSIWMY